MNEIQMVANAGNCVMQFIFDAVRAPSRAPIGREGDFIRRVTHVTLYGQRPPHDFQPRDN